VVESCVPTDCVRNVRASSPCVDTPSRKAAYQASAGRFKGVDYAYNALARIRSTAAPTPEPMVYFDGELDQRDPSSSSHDARLALQARARTTSDAKRAQNKIQRGSALLERIGGMNRKKQCTVSLSFFSMEKKTGKSTDSRKCCRKLQVRIWPRRVLRPRKWSL